MQNKQQKLRTCLQENHYILPSFQAYGGLSGFQDYGVEGSKVKNKFLSVWREFFLNDIADTIVEIETPAIVPYNILKASGHVDRFTDFIVYDKYNICYRADHLAKNWFKTNNMIDMADKVDTWDQSTLEENINKYNMLNQTVTVEKKNLMFDVAFTTPEDINFLRPEIAPAMFVNFKLIQQYLKTNCPFGIAQIGKSYRKEISPSPYTRMREFNQAEIEYFVDPLNKTHKNFNKYKDIKIPLLTADMQQKNNFEYILVSVDEAVSSGLIKQQIMAYFLAKIYMFALKIGLKEKNIRFRQHMSHEMAHYAIECWDLEAYVNNDWLECVGCADRGSFDLQTHSKYGNMQLSAKRQLKKSIEQITLEPKLNLKLIGKTIGKFTPIVVKDFENFTQENLKEIKDKIDNNEFSIKFDNTIYPITKEMITIEQVTKIIDYEEFYPHVIEPSFGIDRLLYAVFEQNFWARDNDDQRIVLSLPKILCPYDVAVVTLSKNDELNKLVDSIHTMLFKYGIKCYRDDSSISIGKKYARLDELGISTVITVDFDSLKDNKVTLRDRDTTKQNRVSINNELVTTGDSVWMITQVY